MPVPFDHSSVEALSGDRVIVLFNPTAGLGKPASHTELAEAVRAFGYKVELLASPDTFVERVESSRLQGDLRAVVAVGGDGTVELVANRIHPAVPIAVLPRGTENLLAKYFRLPAEAKSAARLLHDSGVVVRIDAGRARDRLFLIMFSSGFDADVVRRLEMSRRGNIRHLSYVKPILSALLSYDFPEIRVYCPQSAGTIDDVTTGWVFAFNLPIYASGLRIAPRADPTDGLFDVYEFRGNSLWDGLVNFVSVLVNRHEPWRRCHWRHASCFRVESPVSGVPYQLDGSLGGVLPLDVELLPRRVGIVVPATKRDEP